MESLVAVSKCFTYHLAVLNALYLGSKQNDKNYDLYVFISAQDQVENSEYLTAD